MNAGLLYAALAFIWWGLFPLYFRLVAPMPALQVMSHRVVWCLVAVGLLLSARGQWGWLREVRRRPRILLAFTASALMIGANWLIYIWAVQNGHVIEASLGYFITPLLNVLLGMSLLHERLRRAQWIALGIASVGVLWLTVQAGRPPWIALSLALTFGFYGLMRKVGALGALEGLTLETIVLAPIALALLGWAVLDGSARFPAPDVGTNLWIVALGPITAVPLLLFAAGARRLTMASLGLVQYVGPTIQFMVGVWAFGEPLSNARLMGFALIWGALVVYSLDSWRAQTPLPRGARSNTQSAMPGPTCGSGDRKPPTPPSPPRRSR